MSLIGPGTWSFAGVSLSQPGRIAVVDFSGPFSPPKPKGSNVTLANASGDFYVTKNRAARSLTLFLVYWPGIGGNELDMYGLIDGLNGWFDSSFRAGLQPLVHNHPDGSVRTAQAEVTNVDVAAYNDPTTHPAYSYRAAVDFALPDPLFYGAAVTVSGASPFTATNPGNVTLDTSVRGTTLQFAIQNAVNPVIVNHTTGKTFSYAGHVRPGETLRVHAHSQYAVHERPPTPTQIGFVQGPAGAHGHRRGSMHAVNTGIQTATVTSEVTISSPGTDWVTLAPGLNNLELSDDSAAGTVSFTFVPAYT